MISCHILHRFGHENKNMCHDIVVIVREYYFVLYFTISQMQHSTCGEVSHAFVSTFSHHNMCHENQPPATMDFVGEELYFLPITH